MPDFTSYRATDPRAEYARLRAAYCARHGADPAAFDKGANRVARSVLARHPRAAPEQALAYAAALCSAVA